MIKIPQALRYFSNLHQKRETAQYTVSTAQNMRQTDLVLNSNSDAYSLGNSRPVI